MWKKTLIIAGTLLVLAIIGGYCGIMYFTHQERMGWMERSILWGERLVTWGDSDMDRDLDDFKHYERDLDEMGPWVSSARQEAIHGKIAKRREEIADMKTRLRPAAMQPHLIRFKVDKEMMIDAFQAIEKGERNPRGLKNIFDAHRKHIAGARDTLTKLSPVPGSNASAELAHAFRDIIDTEDKVTSSGMAEIMARMKKDGPLEFLEMDRIMKQSVESTNQLLEAYNRVAQRFTDEHAGRLAVK